MRKRLAFALTVRNAGFKAAAATAVGACGVFLPVKASTAMRIVSVWAATMPEAAAVAFSRPSGSIQRCLWTAFPPIKGSAIATTA